MEDFEKILVDDVIVIAVNLTRSTMLESKEFSKIIEDEIDKGHNRLVIDLSSCEIIDSTFFGVVIMILKKLTKSGGKLKIVEPVNPLEDIFTITNTLKVFNIYETREDAIKSFEDDS